MRSRTATAVVASGLLLASAIATGCHTGDDAWWGLRAPAGPDATVVPISVRIGSSSCNRLDGVTTAETDAAVTITATVSRSGDRDCTSDLRFQGVDVQLDRPLGGRELKGCAHADARPCAAVLTSPLDD